MKKRSIINGSNIDDWATPDYILNWINKKYGNYFDPCPLHSSFDGLSIDWENINYINPPYNRKLKEQFITKALNESKKGKICILLLPASTDTSMFHDIIVPNGQVLFIRGRIKFKGVNTKGEYVTEKTGQFGSMLVIFGDGNNGFISTIDIG